MNKTNKIQTLTVRFSSHLYAKICEQAEEKSITNAEALRQIVQEYFNQQDEVARIETIEATLLAAIKSSQETLTLQINNLVQI